ncbi:MAG: hypothetical protein WCZ26_06560 [Methanothrix soehngenii]|jgi:hypothetical protein
MFPLEFPFSRLKNATPQDWVLDPFCGRGTTNFAARLRGLPSFGIDSNNVAFAITAAKYVNVKADEVVALCESILQDKSLPLDVPQDPFWELCYERSILIEICKIREHLLASCISESEIALRALMLGILHGPRQKEAGYLSNQMPRTYSSKPNYSVKYWIERNMKPPKLNLLDIVRRRAYFTFSRVPRPVPGGVFLADCRFPTLEKIGLPFNWVITSPPYFGMRNYAADQWLRNWFLGGPCIVAYDGKRQIITEEKSKFISELAKVWANVAKICDPGSHLIVRFGALPSLSTNPRILLKDSLKIASCGWRVTTVKNAGFSTQGKRQAEQFGCKIGTPVNEVDLYAKLEK